MPVESSITPRNVAQQATAIRIGRISFDLDNVPTGQYARIEVLYLDANGGTVGSTAVYATKTQLVSGLNASDAAIINFVKTQLGLS